MTPERFHKLKSVLYRRQPDLTVLAADVHKPHNISAIVRTCDAVGIHGIHAVSPGGELRRHHMAAGGSGAWVGIEHHDNLNAAIATLREQGWKLLAAHPGQDAHDFRSIDYTLKTAIVLGSELDGLTAEAVEAVDEVVALPIEGMVESLNVSVAAAVILYEAQRQRANAGMYDQTRLSAAERETILFEWCYPEIAARCRSRKLPYPELSDDGQMTRNPLAADL